ncbi:MAG: hypothetical protein ACPGLV_08330 [Bacteroidia bacterium]
MRSLSIVAALSVIALLFSACGNDDTNTPTKKETPKASDYYPMKAGNYWVYELHETYPDTSYERFMGTDSIHVVGTEIFGTDTFWKVSYNSTFFEQKDAYKYYKDSAGYLIEKPGIKKLSIDNFNDTLYAYNIKGSEQKDFVYVRRYMEKYSGTIQTPAGVFDSLLNLKQRNALARPNTFEGFPKFYNNLYAKGVGKVYYEFGYLSGLTVTEARLVKYKVD